MFHLSFVDLVFFIRMYAAFRLSRSVGVHPPPSRSGLCAVALRRVTITIVLFSGWLVTAGRDPGGIACKRTAPAELLQQSRQEFGNCPSFRAVKHSLALLVSVFPGCQNRRQPFRKLRRCVSFHAVRLWAACPAVFFVAAAASRSLGGVLPATVAAGIRKGRFTLRRPHAGGVGILPRRVRGGNSRRIKGI